MRKHFTGLRVHSDGSMEMIANRLSDSVEISGKELKDLPLEAAVEICKDDAFNQRNTNESGV